MNLYIKLSVCVPRLIPGRGFYAQISSEITSEFPGVTLIERPLAHKIRRFSFMVKDSSLSCCLLMNGVLTFKSGYSLSKLAIKKFYNLRDQVLHSELQCKARTKYWLSEQVPVQESPDSYLELVIC